MGHRWAPITFNLQNKWICFQVRVPKVYKSILRVLLKLYLQITLKPKNHLHETCAYSSKWKQQMIYAKQLKKNKNLTNLRHGHCGCCLVSSLQCKLVYQATLWENSTKSNMIKIQSQNSITWTTVKKISDFHSDTSSWNHYSLPPTQCQNLNPNILVRQYESKEINVRGCQ